jgi:hypothetical protein
MIFCSNLKFLAEKTERQKNRVREKKTEKRETGRIYEIERDIEMESLIQKLR